MTGCRPAADFLQALGAIFLVERDNLNALDRPVGDGDHGSTMARGAEAAAACAAREGPAGLVLREGGQAFRRAAGGASGPLFAEITFGLADAIGDAGALQPLHVIEGISKAAARIRRLGRAQPGDKTMLDALVPALVCGEAALASGCSLSELVAGMRAAAEAGAEATKNMVARSGRARLVEGGGRGHLDPGARSVVLLFTALERAVDATGARV